ncbi:MAG: hypothetical protein NTV25_09315 [Methanothrix sp.]|jgi:hypothetical protein|nr:hypothetical protein [Methanothrix sp.]
MATGVIGKEPEQRGYKSQNFREITPDYIFGGVKPGFIEMIIVTTKANAFEKVVNNRDVFEHTEEASLKIAPLQAKSLITWLLQNIKLYETTYGQIKNVETDATKQVINKKVEDLLATL